MLAVLRAARLRRRHALANDTDYALTAGVFSPLAGQHRARSRRAAGRQRLRQPDITGAVVGRQPFGGYGLSGVGSKAGGPDYLLQFVDPGSSPRTPCARASPPLDE